MVDGVEMGLPIILMLTCVKVAGPHVHVIENGSRIYLLKQKQYLFSPGGLAEPLGDFDDLFFCIG